MLATVLQDLPIINKRTLGTIPSNTSLNCAKRELPPRVPAGLLAAIVNEAEAEGRMREWEGCAGSSVDVSDQREEE
jgi:hypothetical protein